MLIDETNTLAQGLETATETPAPETENTTADQPVSLDAHDETETPETAETEGEGQQEEQGLEFVTVEYDGEEYQVPPKLKEAFLRQQDYTRKTQEVATERKTLESARMEIEQMRHASQEELGARATAINLDSQLQQYANLDWQALLREDPMGFQEHRLNFETLQQQRGQVAQYLQNAEYQRSVNAQQSVAQRLQETRTFAEKEIPGWTPEIDNQVTRFATSDLGFDVDTLKTAYNPQIYKTLWLAMLGQQSLQKSAAKPVTAAPKPQPLQRIAAKTSVPANKSPESMSMDEYAKWRKSNP
jgi:hypothetical protein